LYDTKEPWVLLITLGMSGDLRWNSAGYKHCRFTFLKANGEDLSFVDVRNFGTLRIKTPDEAKKLESKIGWDLLQAPMPKDKWKELKTFSKIENQEIGSILLTQNIFSGCGNIYKSEILFRLKINPTTLIKNIPNHKWESLNISLHNLLVEAYSLNGSSVKDFTADGKEGQAQIMHKVYDKLFCPEGHKITAITQNTRTTWYCKICQI